MAQHKQRPITVIDNSVKTRGRGTRGFGDGFNKIQSGQLATDAVLEHHIEDRQVFLRHLADEVSDSFQEANLTTEPLWVDMECSAGDVVGSFVYQISPVIVSVFTDNLNAEPCIGVIEEKPDSTHARVVVFGPSSIIFPDVVFNQLVFLGIDGTPTSTKPAGGYLHYLGRGNDTGKIFVNPSLFIVKQTPF